MFTGIVQATAGIAAIHDRAGLRTFTLDFPEGFCQDLAIGASVATDGVCLTVTEILSPTQANFDVMLQSLNITTLGSYAQGFAMAQARLGPGRVHHCMRTIGQCELALQLAAERALERHAFGKPLSEQANVQEWLADSRIEIDQARWLVLHAAWLLDQGDAAEPRQVRAQVAAIKVVAARLQQRVVDRAMQIFGAMGLSPDTPLAAFWTWGRALRLMDGPDEVHLRTVARQVLAQARAGLGSHTAYFTTPEQLAAPPHLQA